MKTSCPSTHERGGAKNLLAVKDDDKTLVLGFYSLRTGGEELRILLLPWG